MQRKKKMRVIKMNNIEDNRAFCEEYQKVLMSIITKYMTEILIRIMSRSLFLPAFTMKICFLKMSVKLVGLKSIAKLSL